MNFIDLRDFSREDLENILRVSAEIKAGELDVKNLLKEKNFGLLFKSASTRTRVSFQVGIRQMGGFPEHLKMEDLQLSNHESLKDTASVLGRYLDGLVIRMYDMERYGWGRKSIETFSKYSKIPIINALDDKDHPCQVMADLLTLREKFGKNYRRKKVVFTWAYAERQKSPGVPQSMLSAGSILGMNITFAYPKGFDLDPSYVEHAKKAIELSGGTLNFSNDLVEASKGADVIYAKSWKALAKTNEEDLEIRKRVRGDWTISNKHFEMANPEALFMNCLPIIRGEQATAEVIDRPNSILYDEAENRLHAQKGILSHVYSMENCLSYPELQLSINQLTNN